MEWDATVRGPERLPGREQVGTRPKMTAVRGLSATLAMVHHSSVLAWRVPWREEAGGAQFMVAEKWTQLSDFRIHDFS